MKKIIKNLSLVLFAVMTLSLSLMAVGCSKKSSSTGEDGKLNNATRLVIGQSFNYFPIIVAYEKGFLKDEFGDAFEIEIPTFATGPAQNEALLAGQIDIANMGDLPAIQLWANDADIQVISYLSNAPDGYGVVANKQSGIKTLADLKGKKIATRFGTAAHKLTLEVLASQGLNVNDVELVQLQNSESVTALKQGSIDVVMLLDPSRSQALKDDNIIEIGTGGVLSITFIRTEYARKNPQIVSRYLKVIKKTNDWIAQNAEEAVQIVSTFMGNDDLTETKKVLESRTWLIGVDQELIDKLNDTIKFCREYELITRDGLDAKNLVTDVYVKAAGL